ncbi:MAG: hypothetical protein ACD_76C00055G0002 [uncultured bacterium]|nr:MAG: hypothetical protein ACD_76C00055G0002 [uncultured bacterium]HBD05647.1 hypothetical protein [Candidatus Uhrbacteria bacterium]
MNEPSFNNQMYAEVMKRREAARDAKSSESRDFAGKIQRIEARIASIESQLDNDLERLDDPDKSSEVIAGNRFVIRQGERYFVKGKGTKRTKITEGDILYDQAWNEEDLLKDEGDKVGVYYTLGDDIPLELRRKYLEERARIRIGRLKDWKIMLEKVNDPTTDPEIHAAYKKRLDEFEEEKKAPGLIAEQLVENLVRKLAHDNNLEIEVVSVDVEADVQYKMDFIIRVTNPEYLKHGQFDSQGVGVDVGKSKEFAIQFTTDIRFETKKHKETQIRNMRRTAQRQYNINDIVLVIFAIEDVKGLHKRWEKSDYAPGGLEKLLKPEEVDRIFEAVVGELVNQNGLSAMRNTIESKLAA